MLIWQDEPEPVGPPTWTQVAEGICFYVVLAGVWMVAARVLSWVLHS